MPKIELTHDTFERLQELAEPLVDTPETVIRRLLDAYPEKNRKNKKNHWLASRGTAASSSTPMSSERILGDRKRAKPGEFTPNEEMMTPLLEVLEKAGGELPAGEAIDAVGEVMADRLNEVDRAPLKSGEVRWRNNVRWACHNLKLKGKIDPDSPHGVWKLANSGKK